MSASSDLACALDPVLLARAAGIEADRWQADVLRSTAPRLLLNCCRQSGKSTTTGVLAVWTALHVHRALVLLLSPSLRQSGELFRKCLDVYRALDNPVPTEAESALRLELENGSRIVSLPGKESTVRGFSAVTLLAVDEAARVDDEMLSAILPMLAVSKGRLVALSTPNGKQGWWFNAWSVGGPSWQRVKITAEQCPRLPADFLAEAKATMGERAYNQEYLCQFEDGLFSVFRHEDIQAALTDDEPLWPVEVETPDALTDDAPLWEVSV